MRAFEKLSAVQFSTIQAGGIAILRSRDKEYATLAVRSDEEGLKGHNLPLLLAEAGAEKPSSSAPNLFPYPEWAGNACLDLSKVAHISTSMKGRPLKTPWENETPCGSLILIGDQLYLSAMVAPSAERPGLMRDIFVDIRSGEIVKELRPEPCYVFTAWSISIDGAIGSWPWVQFDATNLMKK